MQAAAPTARSSNRRKRPRGSAAQAGTQRVARQRIKKEESEPVPGEDDALSALLGIAPLSWQHRWQCGLWAAHVLSSLTCLP